MKILSNKITHCLFVREIDMLGCPSESSKDVVEYSRIPPVTEKARLEYEWQAMYMVDGELFLYLFPGKSYIPL